MIGIFGSNWPGLSHSLGKAVHHTEKSQGHEVEDKMVQKRTRKNVKKTLAFIFLLTTQHLKQFATWYCERLSTI